MAGYLSTSAIAAEIRRTIDEARSEITLISPHFKLSDALFDHLKKARRRGVAITLVYDRANFTDTQLRWLSKATDLSLCHNSKLHANCYFNEDRMVIASMDVQEYAPKTYHEMGVLVRRERDKELFKKAASEAQSIIASSRRLDPAQGDFANASSFFLQELSLDLAQVKDDFQASMSFFKDDIEKTMEDMKVTLEFLKTDLQKTKRDLNQEITLDDMKSFLKKDLEKTMEDLSKDITVEDMKSFLKKDLERTIEDLSRDITLFPRGRSKKTNG